MGWRRRLLLTLALLAGACAMPPRMLPPSTEPVAGAYRFWSCDKPCAFTAEPTQETRLTSLVLFAEPFDPGPRAVDPVLRAEKAEARAVNACWSGGPPPGAGPGVGETVAVGQWRLGPDGVVLLTLASSPKAGSVLHLSVLGDQITGVIETWSCEAGCKQGWYAVDGVRIGKPTRERCGL